MIHTRRMVFEVFTQLIFFAPRKIYKAYDETPMKGNDMNKKDVAIIAGPIVGALAFAAANLAAVKIKERRAKKAAVKAADEVLSND